MKKLITGLMVFTGLLVGAKFYQNYRTTQNNLTTTLPSAVHHSACQTDQDCGNDSCPNGFEPEYCGGAGDNADGPVEGSCFPNC